MQSTIDQQLFDDFMQAFYIDPSLTSEYAKHNCRRCKGVGRWMSDDPTTRRKQLIICECVKKAVRTTLA